SRGKNTVWHSAQRLPSRAGRSPRVNHPSMAGAVPREPPDDEADADASGDGSDAAAPDGAGAPSGALGGVAFALDMETPGRTIGTRCDLVHGRASATGS